MKERVTLDRIGANRGPRAVVVLALVTGLVAGLVAALTPARAEPTSTESVRAPGEPAAAGAPGVRAERRQVAECTDLHPEAAPPDVDGQLTAVDTGDDGSAWAVGYDVADDGTRKPVALEWTGTRWRDRSSDLAGNIHTELLGVAVLSSDDVWVVGRWAVRGRSFPHLEHWDGDRWTAFDGTGDAAGRSLGEPTDRSLLARLLKAVHKLLEWLLGAGHEDDVQGRGRNQGQLSAVTAFSADDVWAVGWTAGTGGSGGVDFTRARVRSGRVPLVLRYDGDTWKPVAELPPARDAELSGIAGRSAEDLWVVGKRTLAIVDVEGSRGRSRSTSRSTPGRVGPFVLHRDGNAWTDESPGRVGERDALEAVTVSPRGPFAGGRSTEDGETRPLVQRRGADGRWAAEDVEEIGMLFGVAGTPAADWAVGVRPQAFRPDGGGGVSLLPLLLRRTAGEPWRPVRDRVLDSDQGGWLNAIGTMPTGGGWAVGASYQTVEEPSPEAQLGEHLSNQVTGRRIDLVPLIVRLCGADLTLTGDVEPDARRVGEPLTYTLTVTNLGPHDLASATVTVTVPPEVRVTRAGACAARDDRARRLRCEVPPLRAGQAEQITVNGLAERTGRDVTLTASARSDVIEDVNQDDNTVRVTLDVVGDVPCDRTWRAVPSAPNAALAGLDGVAAGPRGSVWAVGYRRDVDGRDSLLRPSAQRWDGTRWRSARIELPSGTEGQLYDVAVLDRDDAWAVGVEYGDGASGVGRTVRPLILRWDGRAWHSVPVPGGFFGRLNAVAAFSPTDVWAAGARTEASGRLVGPLVLRLADDRWSTVRGVPAAAGAVELFGVTGSGSDRWVVGGETPPAPRLVTAVRSTRQPNPSPLQAATAYVARFDGARWTREASQSLPGMGGQALHDVTIAPDGPLAVGFADRDPWPAAEASKGFAERRRMRAGTTPAWRMEGRVAAQLRGVTATPHGAWAVGGAVTGRGEGPTFSPVLRRWVDGRWSTVRGPVFGPAVSAAFADVTVSSAGDTWAVGRLGQTALIARLCGANLRVTAEAAPEPAFVDGRLTYTVTVTNRGAHPTPRAAFSGALHPSMRLESIAGRLPGDGSARDACRVVRGPVVGCALGDLESGGSVTVRLRVTPGRAGEQLPFVATVASALEDPFPGDNTTRLGVDVLAPAIQADPAVGSPGFVTMVRGTDFPPNAEVTLTWDEGLGSSTVTAGEDGTFVGWMLVFTNDQIGAREIVARFDDGPQPAPTADFLVVPGSQQPQEFLDRA